MLLRGAKPYSNVESINNISPFKYPCKVEVENRCDQRLEVIINLSQKQKEKEQDKKGTEKKAKVAAPIVSPCAGVKPPKKKRTKTIGTVAYSRPWVLKETNDSRLNELPKWFGRQEKQSARSFLKVNGCPQEPDDYEKSLWIPICKPLKKPAECKRGVETKICVFCLGSLYTGGYHHELLGKIPLIKQQSTLYGDEIAWRIGIRTRVTVHRSCYRSYIDVWDQKQSKKQKDKAEKKFSFELGNEEIEESEDSNCREAEGKDNEEAERGDFGGEGDEDWKGFVFSKKKPKQSEKVEEKPRKQFFCLGRYKIPEIGSGPFGKKLFLFNVSKSKPFGCHVCINAKFKTRILYHRHFTYLDWKRIYLKTGLKVASGKMGRFKAHGLVADLWPNIRLLQLSGHFLHEYHDDNSAMSVLMRKVNSCVHLILVFVHFAAIIANLALEADDVNILAANSITVLFFTHSVTKFCYFALRRQKFYRTLAVWDTQNSHPLFAESHARHRAIAVTKSRRLLLTTVIGTLLTVVGWTGSTFFGESTKTIPDPENKNETIKIEIPRLMLRAWYPWDASSGSNYIFSFVYQLYWLVFTLFHANLVDLLFCSWLIFACEQLLHVKEIMKPLIDLSSSLDTYNPGSSDLFKAVGAITDNVENLYDSKNEEQINIRSIYSNIRDFGMSRNTGAISAVNGIGPNGLTKKHEMLVRSAIKYWVERHKHIVRYVGAIGDAYGLALLLHMLTSTITLTLLAYQATKIDGMDLYAMAVLGYLFYSLAQVFAFCIYGNQLIEESSSVMEAAYSCQWYDGSEEAKTFVQIVCQQCQKALSISGAKFFTVSLDLFASVLGAVVTYFMVLVQLK